jgi:uncharacterized membrane protein
MPTNPGSFTCAVCGERRDEHEGKPLEIVNHPLDDLIRRDYPGLEGSALVCLPCRNRYRTAYVRDVISTDRGELSTIENEVLQSLEQQELLARNINPEFDQELKLGGRVADKVAELGGSWTFIGAFAVVLVCWIALNSVASAGRAFDPYPYILLNLVLSCVAAMQAPVIMMSQNRQEAKDRLRAEHDYQVNLKAEIEIRQLHVKLDQLLTNQWHRLLDIQRVQMELIQDLAERPRPNGAADA